MTSISRIDLLRAQLQSQLQRRRAASSTAAAPARDLASSPLPQVQALKAHGTQDTNTLVAALIQDLLLDSLGADLCNDPEFQHAVQAIVHDLSSDPELLALCLHCVDKAEAATAAYRPSAPL